MPRVPTYNGRQVGTRPLPGVRRTPESEGAAVGQAITGFGDTLTRLGAQAQDLYQRRQLEADEMRLRDAAEELARFEIERRTNRENGWMTRRGPAALGLVDTIDQEFAQERGRIANSLLPRQQAAFYREADARLADARRWAMVYSNAQMEEHDQQRHASYVMSAAENGIAASTVDRDRVALERDRIIDETTAWGRRNGWSPEAVSAEITKTLTHLHRGVVLELNAAGQDLAAQQYFERVKAEISGTTRTELQRQVETASTAGTALRAAEMIWKKRGPTSDSDPIDLDLMEEDARVAFRDHPKILDATIEYLRERKAGVDAARKEREDAVAGRLWKAVADGASLADVRRMPAFLVAPGRLQVQVVDAILGRVERAANRAAAVESRAAAMESRAYTRAEREEVQREERAWSRYWELAQPDVLSELSDDALNALRGEIGDAHVNRLFTQKRKVDTPDTLRAATIDAELFNSIAQSAGLRPHAAGQDEAEKARLGQLRNAVETSIDVEQRRRGNKPLTRDEKRALMESIIDQRVMVDTWGPFDTRRVASMVLETERGDTYVPFAEVPAEAVQDYRRYMRGLPGNARRTDRELDTMYRHRLERAWALRLMGGTRAEIEAILQGK